MHNRIDGVLLKSQQAYLKKLGFYNGDIDGFWGEQSKKAMVAYRDSDKFAPANKRRGDGPFVPFERLPKGFTWEILDGQRCVREKTGLPASFAMQELVNLITQPTTAKVEKTAPDGVVAENFQTTNLKNTVNNAAEASTAAATSTNLESKAGDSQAIETEIAQSATEGQSAKGSSQHFQKHSPNNGGHKHR